MKPVTARGPVLDYDLGEVAIVALLSNGSNSLPSASGTSAEEVRFLAEWGVALCRRGEWRRGFEVMSSVAESEYREADLPGVFFSYLAYTVARYRREHSKALALARHAVETRFFEPENYLNLARVQLLAGDRGGAVDSCREGLRIEPRHDGLRRFLRRLGCRRRKVLSFLPRSHAVNRMLGKALYRLKGSSPVERLDERAPES